MSGKTVASSGLAGKRAKGNEIQDVRQGLDRWLMRLVDGGLAAVIFVAPLFMGGRYEIGRLAYVAAVGFTALCWCMRQCVAVRARWRWSGAEPILAAGLLLVAFQVTPLPQWLLLTLSPEIGKLLPLWTSASGATAQIGTWSYLSLAPQATRGGLVTLAAHVMLFLVVVQRVRDLEDIERLLRWLAAAAIGMALLGLAQFLFGNGRFLWIYEHPSRTTYGVVKGPFQNQNHFAHFLALGIGPLLWWLLRAWSSRGDGRPAFRTDGGRRQNREWVHHGLTIGLGLTGLAGLLTFSRGGVVALFIAAVVCLGILVWKGLLGKKAVVAIAGLSVLLGAALAIHGYEPLARRLATLRDSRSLEELSDGRRALWAAHLRAIPKFALTGTGAGSHRDVYRTYLPEYFAVEFTHGENGYLHQLLENGFPGLALGLAGAALAFFWCVRAILVPEPKSAWRVPPSSRKKRVSPFGHAAGAAAGAALVAGLTASMVHSLGDFVWYIPACMSLTIIIAACACRLYQITAAVDSSNPATQPFARPGATSGLRWLGPAASLVRRFVAPRAELEMPRLSWGAITACLFGAIGIMLANRIPPAMAALSWDAYFKLAREARTEARDTGKDAPEQLAAMTRHLEKLLRRDPQNARANVRLAGLYLNLFDLKQRSSANPMALSQIRDAALASQFPSRKAQDRWLNVVLGENRIYLDRAIQLAKRGLALCPLQGEGYVYLAELAFLEGPSPERKRAYVAQALRVRPHEGLVLVAAGGEAALAGDLSGALALWKRAFHQDPEQQQRIIELLGAQMPPEMFLENFEPDQVGLRRLFQFYRTNGLVEPARSIAGPYLAAIEEQAKGQSGQRAANLWYEARSVSEFLGDTQKALDYARNAVAHAPGDFRMHRILALAALRTGQYEEAIRELQWCLSRKPDDEQLRRTLKTASRAKLEQGGAAIR